MNFHNFLEAVQYFSDKQNCIDFLIQNYWHGHLHCPHCNHDKIYELKGKNKRFTCGKCRKQFTAIKGTIFEHSRISLQKWFTAIYIISAHKKGISSCQLAKDLGVTQKTAWFMEQRIRYALSIKSIDKTNGVFSVDETFMGGKNKNRHGDKKIAETQGRSVKSKTPVLGILKVGGKINTFVIKNTKAKTIKPIIKKLVENNSIVITDEWTAYNNLHKNYQHVVVNHKQEQYVNGAFSTNNIENFWSLLKRGIYGIYHQVSAKHLHKYCDEFSFRYNTRTMNDIDRFKFSMQLIKGHLTYKQLVA
jgi:transposase-like protein